MTIAGRDVTARGFTLIELLAGIVVFGFAILLLSQGFRFGLQVSKLTAAGHAGDRLAIERSLRRLVSAADPGIYPEPATLQGSSSTLELTTELPSGSTGPGLRSDAVLSAHAGQLVLRWRLHRHVEQFGPGPAWTETILSDDMERAEFAYLGAGSGATWQPAWTGDRLPALVRLTLVFANHGQAPWPPIIIALVREPLEE